MCGGDGYLCATEHVIGDPCVPVNTTAAPLGPLCTAGTWRRSTAGPAPTGSWICVPTVLNVSEVCDGLDTNCNGLVDENILPVSCGLGECERTVEGCIRGVVPTCTPGTPSYGRCGDKDWNCDGYIDLCTPSPAPTTTAPPETTQFPNETFPVETTPPPATTAAPLTDPPQTSASGLQMVTPMATCVRRLTNAKCEAWFGYVNSDPLEAYYFANSSSSFSPSWAEGPAPRFFAANASEAMAFSLELPCSVGNATWTLGIRSATLGLATAPDCDPPLSVQDGATAPTLTWDAGCAPASSPGSYCTYSFGYFSANPTPLTLPASTPNATIAASSGIVSYAYLSGKPAPPGLTAELPRTFLPGRVRDAGSVTLPCGWNVDLTWTVSDASGAQVRSARTVMARQCP